MTVVTQPERQGSAEAMPETLYKLCNHTSYTLSTDTRDCSGYQRKQQTIQSGGRDTEKLDYTSTT